MQPMSRLSPSFIPRQLSPLQLNIVQYNRYTWSAFILGYIHTKFHRDHICSSWYMQTLKLYFPPILWPWVKVTGLPSNENSQYSQKFLILQSLKWFGTIVLVKQSTITFSFLHSLWNKCKVKFLNTCGRRNTYHYRNLHFFRIESEFITKIKTWKNFCKGEYVTDAL